MTKTNINYSLGAACIIIQDGKIVFEQRAAGRDGAGLLDFCSGHIEPGETPNETMRRELSEELGIPLNLSADLIELGANKMHLAKRQKEKDWDMVFYYLEIPKDFDFVLQNTEVATIIKAPFNEGLKQIKNNAVQFPYAQMIPTINKFKQIYHQHQQNLPPV